MIEDSEELKIYVKMAKTRIVSLYHDTAGACYLSFSGGKDSTVVLALIKECIDEGMILSEIPAVYCDTGIELQATNEFVNWVKENYYSNIQIIKPEKPFAQIIKEYGKPFRSKIKSKLIATYKRNPELKTSQLLLDKRRYNMCLADKDMHVLHPDFKIKTSEKCCDYMKKKPFDKYCKQNGIQGYITGMRAAEGGLRQINYRKALAEGKSPCTTIRGNYTIKSPIIDWSDELVEEFVKNHQVYLSDAYSKYNRDRTGCFLCPFSAKIESDLEFLRNHEPNKYKAAMSWMKDVYIAQNVVLPFDKEYERERKHGVTNIHVCVMKCYSNTDQIAS